jgi:hypothetical protein
LIQATKRRRIEKKRIGGDKKDGPEKYTMDKRLKKRVVSVCSDYE